MRSRLQLITLSWYVGFVPKRLIRIQLWLPGSLVQASFLECNLWVSLRQIWSECSERIRLPKSTSCTLLLRESANIRLQLWCTETIASMSKLYRCQKVQKSIDPFVWSVSWGNLGIVYCYISSKRWLQLWSKCSTHLMRRLLYSSSTYIARILYFFVSTEVEHQRRY